MKKLAAWLGAFSFAFGVAAADLKLNVADKEPPKELNETIRKALQPKAVQIVSGDKTLFEFWFCTEVPLKAKPASVAKALEAVPVTTLLGAVSVGAATHDYRDDALDAGVYAVYFALQPEDGDHLGTADFNYFAVLVPAKDAPKPDAFANFDALVKASGKDVGSSHPHVMSLRPAPSDAGPLPALEKPAPDHQSVRLQLPAKAGGDKTTLTFELVCEGHYKK